jgi:hypothetical protein
VSDPFLIFADFDDTGRSPDAPVTPVNLPRRRGTGKIDPALFEVAVQWSGKAYL